MVDLFLYSTAKLTVATIGIIDDNRCEANTSLGSSEIHMLLKEMALEPLEAADNLSKATWMGSKLGSNATCPQNTFLPLKKFNLKL